MIGLLLMGCPRPAGPPAPHSETGTGETDSSATPGPLDTGGTPRSCFERDGFPMLEGTWFTTPGDLGATCQLTAQIEEGCEALGFGPGCPADLDEALVRTGFTQGGVERPFGWADTSLWDCPGGPHTPRWVIQTVFDLEPLDPRPFALHYRELSFHDDGSLRGLGDRMVESPRRLGCCDGVLATGRAWGAYLPPYHEVDVLRYCTRVDP